MHYAMWAKKIGMPKTFLFDKILEETLVDRVVEYRPDSVEYSLELLFRAGDAAVAASDFNRQYIHVFSGVFVYECLY